MKSKTLKIGMLVIIILIMGFVTAETMMYLEMEEKNKDILLSVGKGIGTVDKVREICNETECYNESYIDTLKLVPNGCDGAYCYFKLYEEDGINKPFKVKLESICTKTEIGEEGEEYCTEWREETDEEILTKAQAESEKILNNIAAVTIARNTTPKESKFETLEVNV